MLKHVTVVEEMPDARGHRPVCQRVRRALIIQRQCAGVCNQYSAQRTARLSGQYCALARGETQRYYAFHPALQQVRASGAAVAVDWSSTRWLPPCKAYKPGRLKSKTESGDGASAWAGRLKRGAH
jgi:hypothetical protein